jgi:hypothetical protein
MDPWTYTETVTRNLASLNALGSATSKQNEQVNVGHWPRANGGPRIDSNSLLMSTACPTYNTITLSRL